MSHFIKNLSTNSGVLPILGIVSFLITCLRKFFSAVVMPRSETRCTIGSSDIWPGSVTDKKRSSILPPSRLRSRLSFKSRWLGFWSSSSQSSILFGWVFSTSFNGRPLPIRTSLGWDPSRGWIICTPLPPLKFRAWTHCETFAALSSKVIPIISSVFMLFANRSKCLMI